MDPGLDPGALIGAPPGVALLAAGLSYLNRHRQAISHIGQGLATAGAIFRGVRGPAGMPARRIKVWRRKNRRFKRRLRRVVKRYTRKRRTRRMRKYKTERSLMPRSRVVKMTFTQAVTIPAATISANVLSNLPGDLRFKCNSVYRPSSMYGQAGDARHDQYPTTYQYYKTLYNQCEVKASRIKYTFRQTGTLPTTTIPNPLILAVRADHGGVGVGLTSYEQFGSDPLIRWTKYVPNTTGNAKAVLTTSWSAKKRWGISGDFKNTSAFIDPTDVDYYDPVYMFADYNSTAAPAMHCHIKVTYYVRVSDPKSVNDFAAAVAIEQHS